MSRGVRLACKPSGASRIQLTEIVAFRHSRRKSDSLCVSRDVDVDAVRGRVKPQPLGVPLRRQTQGGEAETIRVRGLRLIVTESLTIIESLCANRAGGILGLAVSVGEGRFVVPVKGRNYTFVSLQGR